METKFALIALAVLVAGNLFAGSEQIIKQRAKELSNQNNVRQGIASPTQPAAAPTAAAPVIPTPQQQALDRFQAHLTAIKASSTVTAEQKQQIAEDLAAIALGASRPSLTAATKMAEDLSAALAEKPLSAKSLARLVQEIDAVLNPTKYPRAQMQAIFADVQAIFQDNGLVRKKAVAIADDAKALGSEVQKPSAK